MRFVLGALLVLSFASIKAISASESHRLEGVVCRTYKNAISNGMLDTCLGLWRQAEGFNIGYRSMDCRKCKRMIKSQTYANIVPSMQTGMASIEPSDIKHLAMDLKDDYLVCTLLERCNAEKLVLPTLRFNATTTCDKCKKIIDDIRDLIDDNATKSAIATYVKAALCVHLPLQIVDVCKNTVDTYIGVLIDMAANELESGSTCALFGLCRGESIAKPETEPAFSWIHRPAPKGYEFFHSRLSKKDDGQTTPAPTENNVYSWINRPAVTGYEFFHSRLSKMPEKSDGGSECTDCQNVFNRIRNELSDKEFDQKIKDLVKDKLCESFGYFKSMCEAAVSKEVDAMIDGAAKINVTDLCVLFRQCPGNASLIEQSRPKDAAVSQSNRVEIPVVCEFCEAIVKRVIDITIHNKTEEAILWALNHVCELFPKHTASKCHDWVQKYGEIISKAVIDGTAPKVVCMAIGVCGPLADSPPPIKPTLPVVTVPIVQGATCKFCETIVDTIYQSVQSNASKETIIADLEVVCKYIPYVSHQCKNLVDKYAGMVIDMVIEGVPSEEVCRALGFCPHKEPAELGDACAICEVVFVEIFAKLRENATVEELEALLEKVCNYLPTAYVDKCTDLVDNNMAKLLDLIMSKMSPREICQALGVCFTVKPKPVVKNVKCEVCKEIIDFMYTQLEDNATADQVEKMLESVCDYIPSASLKEQCHIYVKAYTQILIDLLVNNVPSFQVCQTLGFCASDRLQTELCSAGPIAWCRDKQTARLCQKTDFCEGFMWDKSGAPRHHNAHSSIRRYDCRKLVTLDERCSNERVMRVCGFAPTCLNFKRPLPLAGGGARNECQLCRNLVTQRLTHGGHSIDCRVYVNPLMKSRCEAVRQMSLPGRLPFDQIDKVCKENNLCDNVPSGRIPQRALIGDDPCVWGPSVFCRDADIAANCRATAYCQQNVWKATRPRAATTPSSVVVPGLSLVDCSRPLAELCLSKDLRFCGKSVLEQCQDYVSQLNPQRSSQQDKMLRQEMCKDRSVSFCADPKMIELCDLEEYCEAMGQTPTVVVVDTPSTESHRVCRMGLASICQSMANAKLCGMVDVCRQRVWA